MGLPETVLIHRGLISFIEKEIRLADADISDLMDRYNVASKEDLYEDMKDAFKDEGWGSSGVWARYELDIRYTEQGL